ncbi:uncharacterized protein LOC120709676 [Panicum virgatum]|uniref:uncharacterized protein LOC120709676 n=1 Tax=Panicum virgatum TaxID=38727 RepID=UPI0019D55738|nr:uncharacterized protein LOC120709676 [Panicum virgatum]
MCLWGRLHPVLGPHHLGGRRRHGPHQGAGGARVAIAPLCAGSTRLRLAGYYRRFVRDYGAIAAPLTALLRKEGFQWSAEATTAFEALKTAVTSTLVLCLPDFDQPFVVECDASTHGFGAVLLQDKHLMAFFRRLVAPRHRSLVAYECELIGLVHTIRHWRPYLWGRCFLVCTDHYSLKYLLDQRLATIPQHHWIGKLLGFDFAVDYKPGAANIIAAVHEDGHEGIQRTLHRLRRDFHAPNLRRTIQDFIRECTTCQRYKSEHLHPAGLLLPLLVPTAVWTDLGLDFVEALPRVGGKSVILMVVDRFSKYCHFILLAHPYTAEPVAQAFFSDIVRLHGVPQSLLSDRDTIFTSAFWRELMRLMGTKLHMTTMFHPQSDGQTEAANWVIIMYLRCFTGERPRQWLLWLPWAEYTYNTAYQSSLKDTPFRIVYGPQAVQKRHYDKGHRDVSYAIGDWVWLRLRHRAPASLPSVTRGKLKLRFYEPYRVIECINEVAVRLQLPPCARLHDVFHIGLLKKYVGTPPEAPPPLPNIHHGAAVPEPERAVCACLACGVLQVLIQWKGESPVSATWEDIDSFTEQHPTFQLEDELLLQGEEMSCGAGSTPARTAGPHLMPPPQAWKLPPSKPER